MNFFKIFLASFVAVLTAFVALFTLGLILMVGIIAAGSSSSSGEVAVNPNSVLELQLTTPIVENAAIDPVNFNFGSFLPGASSQKMGLHQINTYIRKAAEDDNVEGIYLHLGTYVPTGWASMRSIRKALLDFKDSGKFIYAYSEVFTENSYYLASVADSVFMPPKGIMEFNGYSSNPVFFKGAIDKLELKPEIFRVGTFKSAVEPFLRKDMSEASKEQTDIFLNDMWKVYVRDLSASREITTEKLEEIAELFIFGEAEKALAAGLIDEVGYESKALDAIRDRLNLETDDKISTLSLKKYMRTPAPRASSSNRVAVVFAEGSITSGKSSDGVMGSETIARALRKVAKDDKVKAVVFRINSGGGSVLASDVMLEEVRKLKSKKPVIASFGDVSASGGYYIASACDTIVAEENTLTGSIGIFSVFFNSEKFFDNKLGITFDEVETHQYSGIGNPNKPISDVERAFLQKNIEKGYTDFLTLVKEGRGYENIGEVDKIAQGRVWSATTAKDIGLVDEFGDLYDAIEIAAKAAGVEEDYRLRVLPTPKSPFEEIMEGLMEVSVSAFWNQTPISEEMKTIEKLKKWIPENGTYALMPYDWNIQ
ncbi:MAG: signal peptide peptidase SppA [Bacteroidota bacterium]